MNEVFNDVEEIVPSPRLNLKCIRNKNKYFDSMTVMIASIYMTDKQTAPL